MSVNSDDCVALHSQLLRIRIFTLMALALNRARSVQFLTMACKGCKIKVIIDLFVFDWLQFSLRISLAIQLLCCYPIPSPRCCRILATFGSRSRSCSVPWIFRHSRGNCRIFFDRQFAFQMGVRDRYYVIFGLEQQSIRRPFFLVSNC